MGEGVRFDASGGDSEAGKKVLADDVRRLAEGVSDAGVHARLAVVDGQELRMAVREVQQADVAELRD